MAEAVTPGKQGARKWTDHLTGRRIIGGIIAILALLFVFQNTETGEFDFLFFDIRAPKWLWLLGIFAAGFVTAWLVLRHRSRKGEKAQ